MVMRASPDLHRYIAYFSMEIAVDPRIPVYSGGLGILAGDTLRSMADMGLPVVGVTLAHRKGYFTQKLDEDGKQSEDPKTWHLTDFLQPTDGSCRVEVEGRSVNLRAWIYPVVGIGGHIIPVLFLDSDVEGNDPQDRAITDYLYGGDSRYRLRQEIVLGIGGVRMLKALGFNHIRKHHMNEGHAALLALELLGDELKATRRGRMGAVDRVRGDCVFTTHTPVAAGHDKFPQDLAREVLGPRLLKRARTLGACNPDLNMTTLALVLSGYVNGVSTKHGEVSRSMFPGYTIHSVTNGVHSTTWTAPPLRALFDKYVPDWRREAGALRLAMSIPTPDILEAHHLAKVRLMDEIRAKTGAAFSPDVFTIGFARRVTAYKRIGLLFRDITRLKAIASKHGGLQIALAGKAHPRDAEGKHLIEMVFKWIREAAPEVKAVFLPEYTMETGVLYTSGCDIWLNNPEPPLEASGTSGMKAAHNGVPQLSSLDGWWLEGHVEGVTGWSIGGRETSMPREERDSRDAEDLYRKLDQVILPLYQSDKEGWAKVMRSTIALNGSYFNTQRMVQEYVAQAYLQ